MSPSDNQFSAGEQAAITEEFHDDNLPIDYERAEPKDSVSPETDDCHFVSQLKVIGLKSERIRRAILDYYRAFQQRNSWLNDMSDLSKELKTYDARLVDEWARLREIIFEELKDDSPEELLQHTGRELINRLTTGDQMLANDEALRVHWHPRFEERIKEILCGRKSNETEFI